MRKMITNFYCEPQNIKGRDLRIFGQEKRHIVSVLRHKKGDLIDVVDGMGNKYRVRIADVKKNELQGKIISKKKGENEPKIDLSLAQSLCKGFKMDWVVEKATEIGVSSIIPLLTEKTEVKIESEKKEEVKIYRWKRKALSAMKQSLRSRLPSIGEITSLKRLLTRTEEFDLTLFGSLKGDALNLKQAAPFGGQPEKVLVIVGPEAGLTQGELEKLSEVNAIPVNLGERRLRAETAGIIFSFLVLYESGRG
jgi:16S rRNA (uracil1498-N3)-methyltransferase